MCLGSFWTALQLLWSTIYVVSGTIQLITGIFFLITVPTLHFTSNIVAGLVNVIMGITGGAIVCFGKLKPRRQEALLYIACSILIINLAEIILREWGIYLLDLSKIIKDHPYQLFIVYGCFAVRTTGILIIIVSFIDSQFAFCSMQIRPKYNENRRNLKQLNGKNGSRDTLTDVEFVIPKEKPSKSPSKPHAIYNAYAQSWVFETDHQQSSSSNSSNLAACTKITQNGSSKRKETSMNHHHNNNNINNNNVTKITDETYLIDKNPIVNIEEASDDSTSNSDRKLGYMRSFSRSTSPILLSAGSSQLSLTNQNKPHQIQDYLEKLTDPDVYRSRLNSALSDRENVFLNYEEERKTNMHRKIESSISPARSEKVQYACFMQELQRAIDCKKDISPQTTSGSLSTRTESKNSSRQESERKSSDGDFSRELEAALQLIQDLESPNTLNTPSEEINAASSFCRNSTSSEDSDKTQTGEELKNTSLIGKDVNLIVRPNSQSTSGYSSPTHPASSTNTTPQNWSTTSSINGSNNNENLQPVSYKIHNSKCTTVISLYTPNGTNQKEKSVTLVSIRGDNRIDDHQDDDIVDDDDGDTIRSKEETIASIGKCTTTNSGWRSLLRKKKQSPKLCPELEGAIVKSESLAYLSEIELLARHQRNNEMHREIEERVIQQLAVPRNESNC